MFRCLEGVGNSWLGTAQVERDGKIHPSQPSKRSFGARQSDLDPLGMWLGNDPVPRQIPVLDRHDDRPLDGVAAVGEHEPCRQRKRE